MTKLLMFVLVFSLISVQGTSGKKQKNFNGIQQVKKGYEYFFAGNLDGVLSLMAADVHWQVQCASERQKVFRPYYGVEGVADFFNSFINMYDVLKFEPMSFTSSEDGYYVSVRLETSLQGKQTQKIASWTTTQYFWFNKGGKIMKFLEVLDSYAVMNLLDRGQTAASLEILATKFTEYLRANMVDEAYDIFWPDAKVWGLAEDPSMPLTVDEAKDITKEYFAAFPDAKIYIHGIVANNNQVSVRISYVGTHTGTLFGIPPTMKPIDVTLAYTFDVVDGKVMTAWYNADMLTLFKQLGFKLSM